mmetsp:Transcript_16006/g.34665  ORF Transcript_16006/g.34665 Transcript_16006/m.34665 type:complete len:706 (+) Transcript_16006:89-2206(+)
MHRTLKYYTASIGQSGAVCVRGPHPWCVPYGWQTLKLRNQQRVPKMHRRVAAVVNVNVNVDAVAVVVAMATTGFLVWQGCHDTLVGMQGQQDRGGRRRKHVVVVVDVVRALLATKLGRASIVAVTDGILGLLVPVVGGTHSNQIPVGGIVAIAVAIVLRVVPEWFLKDTLGRRHKGVVVVLVALLPLLVGVVVVTTIVLALGFVLAARNGRGGSLPELPTPSGGRGIGGGIVVGDGAAGDTRAQGCRRCRCRRRRGPRIRQELLGRHGIQKQVSLPNVPFQGTHTNRRRRSNVVGWLDQELVVLGRRWFAVPVRAGVRRVVLVKLLGKTLRERNGRVGIGRTGWRRASPVAAGGCRRRRKRRHRFRRLRRSFCLAVSLPLVEPPVPSGGSRRGRCRCRGHRHRCRRSQPRSPPHGRGTGRIHRNGTPVHGTVAAAPKPGRVDVLIERAARVQSRRQVARGGARRSRRCRDPNAGVAGGVEAVAVARVLVVRVAIVMRNATVLVLVIVPATVGRSGLVVRHDRGSAAVGSRVVIVGSYHRSKGVPPLVVVPAPILVAVGVGVGVAAGVHGRQRTRGMGIGVVAIAVVPAIVALVLADRGGGTRRGRRRRIRIGVVVVVVVRVVVLVLVFATVPVRRLRCVAGTELIEDHRGNPKEGRAPVFHQPGKGRRLCVLLLLRRGKALVRHRVCGCLLLLLLLLMMMMMMID